MMAAPALAARLIDRLPPVRGRLVADSPLAPITWFRAGGKAEVIFRPTDRDDLAQFLATKPKGIPVTVIGVASNLLVRDGGIDGVVVRLSRAFADIRIDGAEVTAGAAAMDVTIARECRDANLAGFEFLIGVPGTLGGALAMNAGAYDRELKDVVVEVEALDAGGELHRLTLKDWAPRYRGCGVPADWIFTGARLKGSRGDGATIAGRMAEIQAERARTQPVKSRTGGSTFANPPGAKAWELIDQAGCRGLRIGGAMVSELHTNFLINTGGATAADLEALGEEVRRRVKAKSGITLEWEIRRIGSAKEAAHG
ncbi:MAG: UDP-N-acetylmuramate dehydrogenase [Alphaproteobacteria bacterium]|nr:UDP-N-acetylmuramate dehydrogenase [Alphaproteobacteria bacterium]